MTAQLRVGAATTVVTPSRPGPLAGYIARRGKPAIGTLDELEATALVIDDGRTAVVWVTLDAVAISERLSAEVTRIAQDVAGRDIPVVVAASHTHSAPAHWLGDFAPGHSAPLDEDAVGELVERLDEVLRRAWRDLAPAEARWCEPTVPGLASRRAYPDSPVDVTAGTLVVTSGGRTVAILVDIPCHATVLGPDSLHWSADWPGGLRRSLRERYPDAVVAFANGASGDLSTRFTRQASTPGEADRLGRHAAAVIAEAIPAAPSLAPALTVQTAALALPTLRRDPERARARLAHAERGRAEAGASEAALAQSLVDGARIELAVAEHPLPELLAVDARLVRLGHVTWIALPFEVFSSTADALAATHGTMRLISCAGPYRGYLPDAAAYSDDTYEARTSLLSPEAEPRAREQLTALLTSLPDHPDKEHP